MKKTLMWLVLGTSLLTADINAVEPLSRRTGFLRQKPAVQSQAPSYPLANQETPVAKPDYPVVQIYDTRIEIDDNKRKIFRDYLEEKIKITTELSDCVIASYRTGVIDYDRVANETNHQVIFKSALEALDSGDRNVYDMMLKNAAWRSDVLIGLKDDLLRKNLDAKYELAKAVFNIVNGRYNSGRTSSLDMLKARGTMADLRFLYNVFEFDFPESKTPKSDVPELNIPNPPIPEVEIPNPPISK